MKIGRKNQNMLSFEGRNYRGQDGYRQDHRTQVTSYLTTETLRSIYWL